MTIPPPASGSDPSRIRIGDAERTSALEALGEHLSSGRLDIDEYGERSAKVTQARTVADLTALFDDLPAPHPDLPNRLPAGRARAATVPVGSATSAPANPGARTGAQRTFAVLLAVSGILAVVLFFVTKVWLVFLLPALIAALSGAIWNQGPRGS